MIPGRPDDLQNCYLGNWGESLGCPVWERWMGGSYVVRKQIADRRRDVERQSPKSGQMVVGWG